MEEINEALNDGEVQLLVESPATQKTTEDIPQATDNEASETERGDIETAESSKGASQRIRELNSKAKAAEQRALQAEERAKSLSERLAEITEPIGYQEQAAPQYNPQYEPGEEVSPERLQADVAKTASALVDLRIKQNNAVNRINNESRDSIRKYSQLDPESDNFDRELSDTITEATEAYVRSQPYSASVSKFVDKMMKPYTRAVDNEVGKVTERIAKQVSETALRPTSVRKPEKVAQEKSIAELEQELGIVTT